VSAFVPETLELGTTVRRASIRGKMRKTMFLNGVLKPVFRFDPEGGFEEHGSLPGQDALEYRRMLYPKNHRHRKMKRGMKTRING
jgi:hypothetical protein